jgi:hypothetical protein
MAPEEMLRYLILNDPSAGFQGNSFQFVTAASYSLK